MSVGNPGGGGAIRRARECTRHTWRPGRLGKRLFRDLAHIVGISLSIEGAGVVFIDEAGIAVVRDGPAYGQRVESGAIAASIFFALELSERMHQGNGDVGEYGGAASGNFPAGDGADQAREEDGNVGSGTELVKIADKTGGGVLLGLMGGAEGGAGRGGGPAAAAGGGGVRAAWSHLNLLGGYPSDFAEECGRERKKTR
jgi:hypothetical protein